VLRLQLLLTIAIGGMLATAFAQDAPRVRSRLDSALTAERFSPARCRHAGRFEGRLRIRALPARELIEWAYPEFNDDDHRVLGGPAWMRSALFEVEAIFDPEILTRELPTKPGGSIAGVPPAVSLMMRSLLEDRFKLKYHVEEREVTISTVLLARPDGRLGPDLRRSRTNCGALIKGRSPCGVHQKDQRTPIVEGRGVPIETFIGMMDLAGEFEGSLRNMTGLEGLFDFELPLRAQLAGATLPLTSRYGLKVERRRTRDRVLVVDELREPSPN
jgi:uncharacterized protein (TIGR03435 family)